MDFNISSSSYECDLKSFQKSFFKLHGWISMSVSIFGSIANIVNILVLTRREMRSPTNIILTGLAVADLLVMIDYIPYAFHIHLYERSKQDTYTYGWAIFVLFHSSFSQVTSGPRLSRVNRRWSPCPGNSIIDNGRELGQKGRTERENIFLPRSSRLSGTEKDVGEISSVEAKDNVIRIPRDSCRGIFADVWARHKLQTEKKIGVPREQAMATGIYGSSHSFCHRTVFLALFDEDWPRCLGTNQSDEPDRTSLIKGWIALEQDAEDNSCPLSFRCNPVFPTLGRNYPNQIVPGRTAKTVRWGS